MTVVPQRELSHLVVGVFDDVESGRAALKSLIDSSPELRDRATCIVRDGNDVRLLDAQDGHLEHQNAVFCLLSTAIAGGVVTHEGKLLGDASDLRSDDIIRLAVELEYGHVAVATMVTALEADAVIVFFTRLGAKSELHLLATEAQEVAATYQRLRRRK